MGGNNLGELLRRLRGKESLRDAAYRAGISHNYLSIIERGKDPRSGVPSKPTPDTLKRLSSAYNYPYDEFMKLAGYIEENTLSEGTKLFLETIDIKDDEEATAKLKDLLRHEGKALSDDVLKEILSYARYKIGHDSK